MDAGGAEYLSENRQPGMQIMCGYACDGVRFWYPVSVASGRQGNHDTEQKNRANFEREGKARWCRRGRLIGAARTGGAARHAGQSAE
jgi:hypothetical protein